MSFTAAYSLKSEKDWPVDFVKCEAESLTVFTMESDSGQYSGFFSWSGL